MTLSKVILPFFLAKMVTDQERLALYFIEKDALGSVLQYYRIIMYIKFGYKSSD